MIYKRYELSQSLNGQDIMHIARNAAGMVIFRAPSASTLKEMIDKYHKNLEKEAQIAVKKLAEKSKKPKQKPEPKKTLQAPTRLTKTPTGKFISKSTLEKTDPPRKKSFWG